MTKMIVNVFRVVYLVEAVLGEGFRVWEDEDVVVLILNRSRI